MQETRLTVGTYNKVETETERFEGKDCHAAITRFNELLKQFPGIEAEIDIAKKPWEK